jgi:hypothetical protein
LPNNKLPRESPRAAESGLSSELPTELQQAIHAGPADRIRLELSGYLPDVGAVSLDFKAEQRIAAISD